jgi:hypothetical protein
MQLSRISRSSDTSVSTDSYLGGEELCHPSDNVGFVFRGRLATCEHAGGFWQRILDGLGGCYKVEPAVNF